MKFCARAVLILCVLFCITIFILCRLNVLIKRNYKHDLDELFSNRFQEFPLSVKNSTSKNVLYLPSNIIEIETRYCNTELGFKTILFYNTPDFMRTKRKNDVKYKDCEYKNCIISHNRSKLLTANAVIFYIGIRKERMGKYPPVNDYDRNPNQAWIFTTAEPPEHYYNSDFKLKSWQNTMNWSCLYRLDSDIPNPYGYLIRSDELGELDHNIIYERKTKNALWIVSHCHVSSARRQFVLEMIRNGFDVDILGGCSGDGRTVDEASLQQMIPSYKYFLAFENSICVDYITEKFFNYYNYTWIIIVRGGADYKQLLPRNTYINTAEFKNVSNLVHYLTNLGNDRLKYTNYIKIKRKYISIRWPGNKHCEICRRINNLDKFRKSYSNLDTYLTKNQCLRPNDLESLYIQ